MTARYDIQSGEDGTFIVCKDGGDYTRIAKFIPGEYTAEDESILGNADTLADALKRCRELFSEIRGDWTDPREQCREGWRVIDAALKLAGVNP